ncbi:MAG: RNA polymerase sigma-70 factor (ECF subfamily) [Cyclobacteriaceae bacterium]
MQEIEPFLKEEKHRLSSFILTMARNPEDTQDLLQDSLLTAIEKKDQFKNRASFKTWISTIAINKTLDFLRKEKRWSDNVTDKAKEMSMIDSDFFESLKRVNQTSPFGVCEVKEHINKCFTCISKTLGMDIYQGSIDP